nr:ATP-binding cassette domain-containing protein [Methylibium sp.]
MSTPETRQPLLSIEGLRFRWPRAQRDCVAIERFELLPGETVFVRGPSGCGKSTLLSLAAGVLTADEGTVRLLGSDWRALSPVRRDRLRADHVGYVFQQFNLLPYLSVLDTCCCLAVSRPGARRARPRAASPPRRRQVACSNASGSTLRCADAARRNSRSASSSAWRRHVPSSAGPNW